MTRDRRAQSWFPQFRRTLAYLRPHRRPLILGLVAALGVSAFYTFSVSSIIPLLKVIFADHETLSDWLYRVETERRLGADIAADLPDDPAGLVVASVRPDSPNADVLADHDRIVSVAGQTPGSYALMRRLGDHREQTIGGVVVQSAGGAPQPVELRLRPYRWWSGALRGVAALLPAGKDAHSRLRTLAIVMAALVTITLVGGLCRLANEGLIALAVQRGLHDLRSELAEHVLRLPMAWHGAQPPGDTLGRFATDINKVEVGLTTLFGRAVREPLKAAGVLAVTLAIDWRLLFVAVLGLPIGLLVMAGFGRLVKRAQKRASESWGRMLDHLGERIAGIRVVKAYGTQATEGRRFEREGRTLTRAQTHIEFVDAATKPALEVLAMVAVAAFVVYGASRVFSQHLEPHLFFAAVVCLAGVFDPIRKLGKVNNRMQAAEASARRLLELRDQAAEEPAERLGGLVDLPRFADTIEFRDVSFAYPSHADKLVLAGINLQVRKGQVVALVGPNGSGKTTLMALLLRFYQPTRGRILIDGRDIAEASLRSLRVQIGLVTQDAVIFSDTMRANIAYGADGAVDEAAIQQAARRAYIDDFIQGLRVTHDGRETQGYDAVVSARSLSGGQRQRIALARAILRDPPILILDEATSQVDSESERKIQQALEDVTRDRTTFVIAHRFSTIARADVTVVLNEGRIVAYGRHAELLQTCPFYVNLCETQFANGVQVSASPLPAGAPDSSR
jgi:ABC-type multidrug transport system fused ATPase/permease subunit